MRSRIERALIVLCLFVTVAQAQQLGGLNFVELFSALDANGDGQIERGEVPESGKPAFERLVKLADTSQDGKVARAEYQALLERARASQRSAGMQSIEERFQASDKNRDGKLSAEEFPGNPAAFRRIDRNADGFISQEEARAFARGQTKGSSSS
ncbi:MAG: hypothetical protein U0794_14380 [Isosphaeraceae bacterium]